MIATPGLDALKVLGLRIGTVCSACGSEACWHGQFMCEDARGASTREEEIGVSVTCATCGPQQGATRAIGSDGSRQRHV